MECHKYYYYHYYIHPSIPLNPIISYTMWTRSLVRLWGWNERQIDLISFFSFFLYTGHDWLAKGKAKKKAVWLTTGTKVSRTILMSWKVTEAVNFFTMIVNVMKYDILQKWGSRMMLPSVCIYFKAMILQVVWSVQPKSWCMKIAVILKSKWSMNM